MRKNQPIYHGATQAQVLFECALRAKTPEACKKILLASMISHVEGDKEGAKSLLERNTSS